jgi:hypothetical protein
VALLLSLIRVFSGFGTIFSACLGDRSLTEQKLEANLTCDARFLPELSDY